MSEPKKFTWKQLEDVLEDLTMAVMDANDHLVIAKGILKLIKEEVKEG